jgi:hypothetical protein
MEGECSVFGSVVFSLEWMETAYHFFCVCGNEWLLPGDVIIDFICSVFSQTRNDRWLKTTSNVILRETIVAISRGIVEGLLSDATRKKSSNS